MIATFDMPLEHPYYQNSRKHATTHGVKFVTIALVVNHPFEGE
jgi:hypothetical protein